MIVTLHMALSLNGMAARENDDTDFLSPDNWTIFVDLSLRLTALERVRDVTVDDNRCQVRTVGSPQLLATLRNPAVALLRHLAERTVTAARHPPIAGTIHSTG